MLNPTNVGRWFIESAFGDSAYQRVKDWKESYKTSATGCEPEFTAANASNILTWKESAAKMEFDENIDPELLEYFQKTLSLAKRYGADVILLDPPFYRFDDLQAGNLAVKKIFQDATSEHVKYVSLQFENKACYFTDASHLNAVGQKIFTEKLLPYLN